MDGFTATDRQNLAQIQELLDGKHLNGPSLDEAVQDLAKKVDNLTTLVAKLTGGFTVSGTLTAKPTT